MGPLSSSHSYNTMKVLKDIISGDELCSDSYTWKDVDGVVWEVEGKFITKEDGDYGIASNDEDGGGVEAQAERVINIVDAHKLCPTAFNKKSYMTYIKGYMKNLVTRLEKDHPDRVNAFKSGAQGFVKKVIGEFSEYDFYTGESMNPE